MSLGNQNIRALMEFFQEGGYDVDITALRAVHPELLTWRQYLARHVINAIK